MAAFWNPTGLELAEEVLLVFGNPQVGTGLMQADPTVGIELPLRLLIWDEQGTTHLAFSDPAELAGRFAVSGRLPVLSQLRTLLDHVVAEATQQPT